MKTVMLMTQISASILLLQTVGVAAQQDSARNPVEERNEQARAKSVEVIEIFGNARALERATGSASIIDEDTLNLFEYDDIHRALLSTPGVYVRQEDGYGLRPNIGIRGATSERSSKIAIMEDGILIAPAPYSAPAAYFFPNVSRIEKIEVFKGPSAIRYGPNTVGGAINLVSSTIQAPGTGQLDIAAGQQGYRKVNGQYSQSIAGVNFLVEGIHVAADGFKDLPNGDDTGFEKSEILAKAEYEIKGGKYYQMLSAKVAYSDEVSDETYLGLTDADFAQQPFQRYEASSLDKLDWEHLHVSAAHYIEFSNDAVLFTQAYRRDFNRDWDRLNRFVGSRPIADILSAPDTGINALFLQVLTGERDSLTDDETLLQTLNDRTYYSQGVQSKLLLDYAFSDVDMTLELGARIHQDQVERNHRDRAFVIQNGELALANIPDVQTINNRDKVTAYAAYAESKWEWEKLNATLGARVEHIEGDAGDFISQSTIKTTDTVVLPGFGLFYQLNPNVGFLFGVNKGFVPNSPGQTSDVSPEESWNYEAGFRSNIHNWQIEGVGFFSDYSNLKAECSFSTGCATDQLDEEFNGGEVDIYGLEFALNRTFMLSESVGVPFRLTYTQTQTEFQTAFESTFAQWGNVSVGDELPYVPEHQLAVELGIAHKDWHLAMNYKFVSETLEAAGVATPLEGIKTDELSQFDISMWYQVSPAFRVYGKLDNAFDDVSIVSRRPFGARPNKPRQLIFGVKYAFE